MERQGFMSNLRTSVARKKILLVGAAELTVNQACELGADVVLFDKVQRLPPCPGMGVLEAHGFDYVDCEAAVSLARDVAKRHVLTAVLAFSEFAMVPAALMAEALGVPGIPVFAARAARDKLQMRNLMKAASIPSIDFSEINTFEDLLAFYQRHPAGFILKPAQGTASTAVFWIRTEGDLPSAWQHCARQGCFPLIAEEFIEGEEFSAESIGMEGQHEILALTAKFTTGAPHFIETGHRMPAALPEALKAQLHEQINRLFAVMGYAQGAGHTEFKLTPAHEIRIIETHTRVGGDMIVDLAENITGIDIVRETLRIFIAGDYQRRGHPKGPASAIHFIIPAAGRVEEITGFEECRSSEGVLSAFLKTTAGDTVPACGDSHDRQGFVIAIGCDPDDALDKARRAAAKISFRYVETSRQASL